MEKNHILVVDDVPENIHVLLDVLKHEYIISVATNGEKALNILENDIKIDLILLDIMMPKMDGFKLCEILKENQKTKDIPVIFISILDDQESILKGFEVGGVDYVAKPFEIKEVLTRVNTHIQLSKKQKDLEKKLQLEKKQREEQENLMLQREKLAEMGEMIRMISHQMKQPLSSISLDTASIKADQEINGEIKEDVLVETLNNIEDNVQFLSDTIDDFRDFLRADTKKSKISLQDTINKALKIINGTIKKKNITLQFQESKEDYYVKAYQNELIQTILNVIKNAIDVLLKKEIQDPKITIRILKKNETSFIEIEDNGGGVADDKKELIFKSGYTTKNNSQGSGLGLYICKLIMQNHCKGKIGVKDGKDGAIFYLEFPHMKE